MLVRDLYNGFKANPAVTKLVKIAAGTYQAGGVNTCVQSVTVDKGFFTPPGEVTNAQAQAVVAKYGDTPKGLFLQDRTTGHYYLYAMGLGDDARKFKTIDPRLLPPQLGIGESFETLARNKQILNRLEFSDDAKDILPNANRYLFYKSGAHVTNPDAAAPDAAITQISGWQAQALAQLLGDEEIAGEFFDVGVLGGTYYADLLTSAQWGLMAMEGALEFMTLTGNLASSGGAKLRAYGLSHIVRAAAYPALPNGVLPNTVWNRVKNIFDHDQFQILRGGSWSDFNDYLLRTAYCFFDGVNPVSGISTGLRVGFFPRTEIGPSSDHAGETSKV